MNKSFVIMSITLTSIAISSLTINALFTMFIESKNVADVRPIELEVKRITRECEQIHDGNLVNVSGVYYCSTESGFITINKGE